MITCATADGVAESIREHGYAVVQTELSGEQVAALRSELVRALVSEDEWHGDDRRSDHSMVLVCPLYSTAFASVLEDCVIWEAVSGVLGESAITYAFTSSSMPPSSANYSSRIHNDCPRSFGDLVTNLGLTLPLDEFTVDNGATFLLPGSHRENGRPTDAQFYEEAIRFEAAPGTALIFDARMWHAGGANSTHEWRHSLTVNFCRSWMKQRIDLPRLLGPGYRNLVSARAAQRLGYNSQVPASYAEYYQPSHRRLYTHIAE